MAMTRNTKLRVGDIVRVRTKEEILATLDADGRLDGLPFMPEMFRYTGREFTVAKRAHKTCDTVFPVRGRTMTEAVHLETRCDGEFHGGCEAGCVIFWKKAWLEPVAEGHRASLAGAARTPTGCSEEKVMRGTRIADTEGDEPTYICQATQLPYATGSLSPWNPLQYLEDFSSGNVGLADLVRGFTFVTYRSLINLGIGLGTPLRWLYDTVQRIRQGVPYPLKTGKIPRGAPTPTAVLNVQPGECVRVKSHDEILATCDEALRNRGMNFDKEMVPYCGHTFRVLKRITRIIDEKTGKMRQMKNPCIVLDGSFCRSRYSERRMFCPRAIFCYWREIWLERVDDQRSSSAV
jgi:hypothetical protein